jgi:hypothetical protein
MSDFTAIATRLAAGWCFLVLALGVPLRQHVCTVQGALPLFALCPLHDDTPAADDADECCCAARSDEENGYPVGFTSTEAGGKGCCSDVDVLPALSDVLPELPVAPRAPLHGIPYHMPDAVTVVAVPAFAISFLAVDSSPPPSAVERYLLHDAFLI